MDALRRQFLVDGSSGIADMIASAMQLTEYLPGTALFNQGDRGGDLYFLLAGKVSINVDGRQVATVDAGSHVGEIGMLEPFKGRSASVVAVDTVVSAHITQATFLEIARQYPDLFRRLALELGHRLVDTQRRG